MPAEVALGLQWPAQCHLQARQEAIDAFGIDEGNCIANGPPGHGAPRRDHVIKRERPEEITQEKEKDKLAAEASRRCAARAQPEGLTPTPPADSFIAPAEYDVALATTVPARSHSTSTCGRRSWTAWHLFHQRQVWLQNGSHSTCPRCLTSCRGPPARRELYARGVSLGKINDLRLRHEPWVSSTMSLMRHSCRATLWRAWPPSRPRWRASPIRQSGRASRSSPRNSQRQFVRIMRRWGGHHAEDDARRLRAGRASDV